MTWTSFSLDELRAAQARGGRLYHEFLRVPAMSAGLYVLKAGGVDPQKPHKEDEVYVILSGRGKFVCEGETIDVESGQTIYVPAGNEHRFFDVAEDLDILVIFAPAEAEQPSD
jgi:mannose-6-phosphate isomerase-like protein (cupin superfamily)